MHALKLLTVIKTIVRTAIAGIGIILEQQSFTHSCNRLGMGERVARVEWANSKIIRIKIHYVLEAIAAFKVIFHFCLLTQIHKQTKCGIVGTINAHSQKLFEMHSVGKFSKTHISTFPHVQMCSANRHTLGPLSVHLSWYSLQRLWMCKMYSQFRERRWAEASTPMRTMILSANGQWPT